MGETPISESAGEIGPRMIPAGWANLVTCGSFNEAELKAAILNAAGIETRVFGANTNAVIWFWQVFNDVDILVPQKDFERAGAVLSQASIDDVEPAEEPSGAAPPASEDGRPLVQVGAFDNFKDLRDAQTVLASAQIDAYVPRVVLRGDRPAGFGKRFILRVVESDLEAAKALLAEEAEDDLGEPHCPKCGSWTVKRDSGLLTGLARLAGLGKEEQIECEVCHYRGPASDFLNRADG